MGHPHRLGIVGLGNISTAYLETLVGSSQVQITAVADLDAERARAVAATLPQARALTVAELLASDEVDTVLNLTIPAAHAEIALAAIKAGKNVYGEKPLAATMTDARAMVAAALAAGVRLGSAPDTVLGEGLQTARHAVDAGLIGRPLAASAVMMTPGHERWHPNPDFYYQAGGGPLLDMGPYYVAALVHLLGPVRSVTGASSRLRSERTIGSGPRSGAVLPVAVDTHVSGVLEHASGVLSTITTSFDAVTTTAAPIEVHGETGTLSVPDPNRFDGETRIFELGATEWRQLPAAAGYRDGSRGVGLVDFIMATPARQARATGDLALHSLDVMTALLQSAAEGRRIDLGTTTERPEPVPLTGRVAWLR
ncbi:Gfo/Idh/MocA family protein [Cryobacterium soli]|uniref:Gfo/Idh/MocA family protein n=1 Tax=Cryobacterium soli TaxID=2220095 RepID=UPI000E72D428|nr:Gfo/Idh/MocA family oxidoreductase [Cryobacterium soli]